MICPIVISTVHGKGLPVLLESIKQYAPEVPIYLRGPSSVVEKYDVDVKIFGAVNNFGDDYNSVIDCAMKDYDSVIVANDDIVLTPCSYRLLMDDVEIIKSLDRKIGWVASRSDSVRQVQNIRYNPDEDVIQWNRFASEGSIRPASIIAPIFAWIGSDAWRVSKFPPLNWYSDDVHCLDLARAGFEHYVSVSYVHHVGSQTVGNDIDKLNAQARPWIEANRPEYAREWFET